MQERFNTGGRYDALGRWPAGLCGTDPETNIIKEISDEEVQASCAEVRGDISDPDGRWLLKKLRTNQIVSALIRGASQLGCSRQAFKSILKHTSIEVKERRRCSSAASDF